MNSIKQSIQLNLKNIPGWRIRRKIVVIECDDWGGIRMPSKEIYDILFEKGLLPDDKRYNRFDTLETYEDLDQLYSVLGSVKDRNGNPAVMTAVTNVANPDFEKIRETDFREYHYEKFTETLKKYYPSSDVFAKWMEGIASGVFVPELHGREHISVPLWMQQLRSGNADLRFAFERGFVFLSCKDLPSPARDFRPAFYFTSDTDKPFLVRSIHESVSLFTEIFGFSPKVFVPANGICHPDFEREASLAGIEFFYTSRSMPYPVDGGGLRYVRRVAGRRGPGGITYYSRNCIFEPNDKGYAGTDLTLRQISASFRWGKPAFISTHRVNFAGGIDPENRSKGLNELGELLRAIVTRWPETEFMSSAGALEIMRREN